MVIFYFKTAHRRDVDNYYKFVGDSLKKCDLIEDDSFKNIEIYLRGRVDRNNPRTEIYIWELDKFEKLNSKRNGKNN